MFEMARCHNQFRVQTLQKTIISSVYPNTLVKELLQSAARYSRYPQNQKCIKGKSITKTSLDFMTWPSTLPHRRIFTDEVQWACKTSPVLTHNRTDLPRQTSTQHTLASDSRFLSTVQRKQLY